MFVLGIDPGLSRCGYCCLDTDGRTHRTVALGVLTTPPSAPVPERLAELAGDIRALFDELRPQAVAVERVLFQVNVRTAISVGQASGLVLAEAAGRGCDVVEYSPNQVKGAVAGHGSADKDEVATMVQWLLGLSKPPHPADAADAAAIALCHVAIAGVGTTGRRVEQRHQRPGRPMIGSLRGTLLARHGAELTIEVAGIGYRCAASPGLVAAGGELGDELFCWVHHHLREDAQTLYAFATEDERELFEVLIGAHGVGPALAMAILGVHSPGELARAVAADDLAALCLVPGVGKKTAARLLIELKSRLDVGSFDVGTVPGGDADGGASGEPVASAKADVRSALGELGYSADEANRAVAALPAGDNPAELLRAALAHLAGD